MGISKRDEFQPLVVKYVKWKVLWRVLFPFLPVIVIGFVMGFRLINKSDFIGGAFFIFVALSSLFVVIEMLLVKEYQLEFDRIKKIWYVFGKKEIEYEKTSLGIIKDKGLFKRLSAFSFEEKQGQKIRSIVIDRNLIDAEVENTIFIVLKSIFTKNNHMLEENSFISFKE
jgi:hypothetical protein